MGLRHDAHCELDNSIRGANGTLTAQGISGVTDEEWQGLLETSIGCRCSSRAVMRKRGVEYRLDGGIDSARLAEQVRVWVLLGRSGYRIRKAVEQVEARMEAMNQRVEEMRKKVIRVDFQTRRRLD